MAKLVIEDRATVKVVSEGDKGALVHVDLLADIVCDGRPANVISLCIPHQRLGYSPEFTTEPKVGRVGVSKLLGRVHGLGYIPLELVDELHRANEDVQLK